MRTLFLVLIGVVLSLGEPVSIAGAIDSSSVVQPSDSSVSAKPLRVSPVVKKEDHRYQIIGGLAMMAFVGIAMGVTQSMNPD